MVYPARSYVDYLIKRLREDPDEAISYLNAHLQDDAEDAEELFLMALGDVAKAYGVAEIAKTTKLGRESLYKTLSKNGNPKFTTLNKLLDAMGMQLSVTKKQKIQKKAHR